MTITIDATYEGGVLVPAQPLALNEHEKVRVTVEPHVQPPTPEVPSSIDSGAAQPPIWEGLAALARNLPPGALDNLPDDLAAEHDHYLYGTPKRFE